MLVGACRDEQQHGDEAKGSLQHSAGSNSGDVEVDRAVRTAVTPADITSSLAAPSDAPEGLKSALRASFDSSTPSLIEVEVQPSNGGMFIAS
jgi:hypothetical protein